MKILLILGLPFMLYGAVKVDWQQPPMPYPEENRPTAQREELGKLLFFDKRLSRSDDIACATCHRPELAWTDGLATARGHDNRKGRRNTPTLVNVGYLPELFWDGRASSLEAQASDPIVEGVEMNMPLELLVPKLNAIAGYRPLFEAAYPGEGITATTISKALAAFQRTIISDNTPFDHWINGKKGAGMDIDAIEGLSLFSDKGRCIKCHNGFLFTRGGYNNIGLGDDDLGVYELNKNRIWYGAFKTPTLREVARTSPYFHDGSVHTLEEAVYICGNGGRFKDAPRSPFFRDRKLTMEEVHKIVAFLKTLSSDEMPVESPTEFPQ